MRYRTPPMAAVVLVGVIGALGMGCKPAAVVAPAAPAPVAAVEIDTKLAWMLRLEQARALRDTDVVAVARDRSAPRMSRFQPARTADLEALELDPDASVRVRAVTAIGRVGSRAGLAALTDALHDPDANVRAAAAFGLGLLGADDAPAAAKAAEVPDLTAALSDESMVVRARAIDALGLIADPSAGPAVVQAATTNGCAARIEGIGADDEAWPMAPEIEVCRSALFALARMGHYDDLAAVALDAQGNPVSRWWPVAFALERIHDPRAIPALRGLAASSGIDTAAFALHGLGALKASAAAALATTVALGHESDIRLRVEAVRLLGQLGGASSTAPLVELLNDSTTPRDLLIEVLTALGTAGNRAVFDTLTDFIADQSPAVRAAAIEAAAKVDPDAFLVLLAGMDRDADWSVRAAIAEALGAFPADRVAPSLEALAADEDARVHGPALEALAHVKAPDLTARLFAALGAPDFVERATAARLVGETKPEGGVERLQAAYTRAASDATYVARVAALEALAQYGGDGAVTTLRAALADPEWPVRLRAAALLGNLGHADAEPARPATLRKPAEFFSSPAILRPRYLPHAFIDTPRGTIEVELDVTNATITVATFIEQATSGFFNGLKLHRVVPGFVIQDGDPRGDGEGGPGYTVPDELSPVPFLRGTMGVALDSRDTGGSQWFITLSPAPHLDGRYTAFGRVVNGWDVLDRLEPWDVIERIRIWDGVSFR